jgi:hypothetical protein
MTVNIPRNLLNKTGNDLLQYADPITEELDAKSIVAGRVMSAQMNGDGSGVIGVISGTPTVYNNGSTDELLIQLSTTSANAGKSHIGWFNLDDKLKFATTAGAAQVATVSSGTISYYKVLNIDEENDQIRIGAYSSADAKLNIDAANDLSDGDYIVRYGTTLQDWASISTNDYNTMSECMVGLESLTAADGRKVNGVTHSGIIGGSRRDCNGAPIDSSDFQKVLSLAKRRAGRGRYKYRNAFMFDTVYDALVESRETDRRFQSVEDGKRGVKMLGYQHGADFVEFLPDELVSKQRVWILPESKEVLEMHGKDFEPVEVNPGQKFHLSNASSGSGHSRQQQAYLEGSACVIVKHAAAIAVLEDFTV